MHDFFAKCVDILKDANASDIEMDLVLQSLTCIAET